MRQPNLARLEVRQALERQLKAEIAEGSPHSPIQIREWIVLGFEEFEVLILH